MCLALTISAAARDSDKQWPCCQNQSSPGIIKTVNESTGKQCLEHCSIIFHIWSLMPSHDSYFLQSICTFLSSTSSMLKSVRDLKVFSVEKLTKTAINYSRWAEHQSFNRNWRLSLNFPFEFCSSSSQGSISGLIKKWRQPPVINTLLGSYKT